MCKGSLGNTAHMTCVLGLKWFYWNAALEGTTPGRRKQNQHRARSDKCICHHWDRREYTETGESWEAGALVCLVVWSNQIPSDPPPVRKKWEDAVNCSSMESDDSSVGNDDSSVENGRAPWYLWSWTSKMEIILCGQVNVKHWSETWFSSPAFNNDLSDSGKCQVIEGTVPITMSPNDDAKMGYILNIWQFKR